ALHISPGSATCPPIHTKKRCLPVPLGAAWERAKAESKKAASRDTSRRSMTKHRISMNRKSGAARYRAVPRGEV
uniref:Uncharacterized protein n=1 Tax=Romanomermis culicivorax TaxID=13658 RepID=A0A915KWZ7_ROMCU